MSRFDRLVLRNQWKRENPRRWDGKRREYVREKTFDEFRKGLRPIAVDTQDTAR